MDFQTIIKAILSANAGVSLSQAISISESILSVQTNILPTAARPAPVWDYDKNAYVYRTDDLLAWARSLPEIREHRLADKPIHAIKALRDSVRQFNSAPTLKETKDAIDRYWTEG